MLTQKNAQPYKSKQKINKTKTGYRTKKKKKKDMTIRITRIWGIREYLFSAVCSLHIMLFQTLLRPFISFPPTPAWRSEGSCYLFQALGASGQGRGRKLSPALSKKLISSSPSKPLKKKQPHTHPDTRTHGDTHAREHASLRPQPVGVHRA